MPGHNIDRCFKIHGFPPNFKGFKDRKVVAFSQSSVDPASNDSTLTSQEVHAVTSEPISVEQFNQLFNIFQKHNVSDSDENTVPHHTALLTGTLYILSSSNHEWI